VLKIKGPYLGQSCVTKIPEPFAEGIINDNLNASPTFSPDGREVFWKAVDALGVFRMKLEGSKWSFPEEVKFSKEIYDYRAPFFSPKGDKIFFLCKSTIPFSSMPAKVNLWYVEKKNDGWSKPKSVCRDINCKNINWQVSVSNDGSLYFPVRENGKEDIYYSKCMNGIYYEPEKLSDAINTDGMVETTPYIAPDESYLIFSRMEVAKDGYSDLYVSYKLNDGSWSKARNLGKTINGEYHNLSPQVSPDGKYLFYLQTYQGKSRCMWVDASVLDEFRPENNPITAK
jgi:Tol biopolymer transport system component